MRVVFDALAATRFSGGMALHAREIITTWAELFPDDTLTIVCGQALKESLAGVSGLCFVTWPNESVFGRAPGQLFCTPVVGLFRRADKVVSLSPIVSPLVPKGRSVCFQHDWRHLRRPEEFPWGQKLYRQLWALSAKTAGMNVCISAKAQAETLQVAPCARTVVIENGRDHARRWHIDKASEAVGELASSLVTFGHHNNKRPELVMRAFAQLPQRMRREHPLVVLGARGAYQAELAALASDLGIQDEIRLPGFVEDGDYHALVANAAVVLLMSSDEGFGLPLAEAEYFGIPSIVSSDCDVSSLFPEAIVSEPDPHDLAKKLSPLLDVGETTPNGGDQRSVWGWGDTVRSLRALA